MTSILCILDGGMGDQLLALPAIRYLASALPARIELRIGGWKLRHKLFRTLLAGSPLVIKSLEAVQLQQPDKEAPFRYDVIVDFDTRDLPHGAVAAHCLKANHAYFSFADTEPIEKQVHLRRYDASSSPFWQRCYEMGFRAASLVQGRPIAMDELLACRDRFRSVSLVPPSSPIKRRIKRLLPTARANRPRLAITPGGYNPPYKRWPIERFAEVAYHAVSRGADVFVLGSRAEAHLSRQLTELMERGPPGCASGTGRVTLLHGRLALEELPYFLSEMDLHLSNDNGVAHLGGLLNRPQLVLYRGLVSPHRSVGFKDIALFSGDNTTMRAISTSVVVKLLDRTLHSTLRSV